MDTMEMLLEELAAAIGRLVDRDGSFSTEINFLQLVRASAPTEPIATVHEPSLCILAQGSKQQADDVVG